jgi:hypothetical protein
MVYLCLLQRHIVIERGLYLPTLSLGGGDLGIV